MIFYIWRKVCFYYEIPPNIIYCINGLKEHSFTIGNGLLRKPCFFEIKKRDN